ncbi:hypothetical protein HA72_1357 [Metallosphaera sedula]|uniref:DUF2173 family protein n=3 Tax=Metallosphaera TaxID=41980 RepID=A4YGG3_METS5|nr:MULTISPECIES: DUF2173 family protein [Metallosphaera]ABP95515.1 conserved hypothetical protein [Metallosphaera sedula DSM 5348]AIM27499.1 hypothetical protein HA72_1357 [Metallosphaera sedula]AKV74368.1 hypothetical protein MsedA_1375 [Metallosphaera sedula]AKV76607.1 hypothetical protein MsedB_1377 [Metallosphaera sedula]AKV78859.1 hypothetical protein MsedC_1375 [Metallosphaera sedula]
MSESQKLERLMKLKGAVAAGKYTMDGKLAEYKGNLPKEMAEMVAMMCAANTMMGRMQAEGFSKFSGMKWSPFHGWAVAAGDYAVCVMGQYGVFVEMAKADFNEIFKTLMEVAK